MPRRLAKLKVTLVPVAIRNIVQAFVKDCGAEHHLITFVTLRIIFCNCNSHTSIPTGDNHPTN